MILNQGLQRGHDDRQPTLHNRGKLVTQALSTARWHQDEAVVATQSSVDGFELVLPELTQTERLPKSFLQTFGPGEPVSSELGRSRVRVHRERIVDLGSRGALS